jgi:hypothetical protein
MVSVGQLDLNDVPIKQLCNPICHRQAVFVATASIRLLCVVKAEILKITRSR